MISRILGALSLLKEIWEAIKVFLSMIKKAKHEKDLKEIDEKTKESGDPDKPLEDRLKSGSELEDIINRNT